MPNDITTDLENFLSESDNQLGSSLATPNLPDQAASAGQEQEPAFPSAADFSDEYFGIFPEADLQNVKKAYTTDYKTFLKDQGVSGAQLAGRIARIESVFDRSGSASDIRELLDSEKQSKELENERNTGIERADRFIERSLSENPELSFSDAKDNFNNYYSARLTEFNFSEDDVAAKVSNLDSKLQDVNDLNQLKGFFDPDFTPNSNQPDGPSLSDNLSRGAASSLTDLTGKTVEAISTFGNSLASKYGDVRLFGSDEQGNFKLFQAYSPEEVQQAIQEAGTLSFDSVGQFGQDIQQLGSEINEDADQDSTANKVGQVAGQLLGFLTAGVASKSLAFSAAVLSGGEYQLDDYEQSLLGKNLQFNQDEAKNVAYLGGAIGSLESLPAFKTLGRLAGTNTTPKLLKWFDDNSGGAISRIIKSAVPGAIEESLQEATSQLLSNLVAKNVIAYDQERDIWQGTKESAETGAAAGGVINGLAGFLAGNKRVKTQQSGNQDDRPTEQGDDTQNDNNIDSTSEESVSQTGDSQTVRRDRTTDGESQQPSDIRESSPQRTGNAQNRLGDNLFGRTLEQELQNVEQRKSQAADAILSTENDTLRNGESDSEIEEGASSARGSTKTEASSETQTTLTTQETTNENDELSTENQESEQGERGTSQEESSSNQEAVSGQSESSSEEISPYATIYPDRESALAQVDGDSGLIFGNKEIGYGISTNPEEAADFQGLANDGDLNLEDLLSVPTYSIVKKNNEGQSTTLSEQDYDDYVDSVNSEIASNVKTRVNTVASISELPIEVQQSLGQQNLLENESVPGLTYRGQVYLIRDQIDSQENLQEVVYHELYGHAGLRNFYGTDIFNRSAELKTLIESKHGSISEYAGTLGIDLSAYENSLNTQLENGQISELNKDRILIEEVLAHVVQKEQDPSFVDKAKELLALVVEKLKNTRLDVIASRFETPGSKTRVILRDARRAIQQGENTGNEASSAGGTIQEAEFDSPLDADKPLLSRIRTNTRPFNDNTPNRFNKLRAHWFTSAGGLPERVFNNIKSNEWEGNADAAQMQSNIKELERNLAIYNKNSKLSDNAKEIIDQYLKTSDSEVHTKLEQDNAFLREPAIQQDVRNIRDQADVMINAVSDVVMDTAFLYAKSITDGNALDVYSTWLQSVSTGVAFDTDFDASIDRVNAWNELSAQDKDDSPQFRPTDTDFGKEKLARTHAKVLNSMILHAKILDSQGSYVNRSFAVHDQGTSHTWDNIKPGVKQNAINEVIDNTLRTLSSVEQYQAKRSELRLTLDQDDSKRLSQFDKNTSKQSSNLQNALNDQQKLASRAKNLGGWKQLIARDLGGDDSSLRKIVRSVALTGSDDTGIARTGLDARAKLKQYIDAQNKGETQFGSLTGSADARLYNSILMKRGDYSPAILELLGEHKDVSVSLPRSVGRSAQFIQTYKNQKDIFDWLTSAPEGQLITAKNDPRKDWVPLPKGANWPFLEGRSVPEHVFDTLVINGMLSASPNDKLSTPFGRALVEQVPAIALLSGKIKQNLVSSSLGTISRNAQSALFMGLPAAQRTLLDFVRPSSRSKFSNSFKAAFSNKRDYGRINKEYLELGVINQNVQLGVIQDLLETAKKSSLSKLSESAKSNSSNPVGYALKANDSLVEGTTKLFEAGDNYMRIFIYESLLADAKERGITDSQEAKVWARDRLSNTYPSYDRTWNFAKELGKAPVVGNFVSFQAELFRTTTNNILYTIRDLQDAKQLRQEGDSEQANKIQGQAAVRGISSLVSFGAYQSILAAVLTGTTKILSNFSEEDREKDVPSLDEFNEIIRFLQPDYAKNSTLAFLGVNEDGNPVLFDTTRMSGHGSLGKIWTALAENPELDPFEVVGEALGGATDTDLGLRVASELLNNKDQYDRSIFDADKPERFVDYVSNSGLIPKFYKEIFDAGDELFKLATEEEANSADFVREAGKLAGVKTSENKLAFMVRNKLSDEYTPLKKAEAGLKELLMSKDAISDDEIQSAVDKVIERRDSAYPKITRIVDIARKANAFALYHSPKTKTKSSIVSKSDKILEDDILRKVRIDTGRSFGSSISKDVDALMQGKTPRLKSDIVDYKSIGKFAPDMTGAEKQRRIGIYKKIVREYNSSGQ